jgi:hypothetical protein
VLRAFSRLLATIAIVAGLAFLALHLVTDGTIDIGSFWPREPRSSSPGDGVLVYPLR